MQNKSQALDSAKADIANKQAQLKTAGSESLKAQIDTKKTEATNAREKANSLNQEIQSAKTKLESAINELNSASDALNGKTNDYNSQIDSLNGKLTELNKQIEQENKAQSKQLEKLEAAKAELETKLAGLNGELDEINKGYAEIEKELNGLDFEVGKPAIAAENNDGSAEVSLPSDAVKAIASYEPSGNSQRKNIELEKVGDSWQIKGETPKGVSVVGDKLVFAPDSIKNNTELKAQVFDENGNAIEGARAIADENGNFSIALPKYEDGTHSVSVKATDLAGNESEAASVSFSIDQTAPNAPEILDILVNGEPIQNGYTNAQKPVVKGTAEAGAVIELYDGENKVGQGKANEKGEFEISPSENLGDGKHSFKVLAIDEAGNTSPLSNKKELAIDTTPSKLENFKASVDEALLAAAKEVLENGTPISKTQTADRNGNFIFKQPLSAGEHELVIRVTDRAGNQKDYTQKVVVDLEAPKVDVRQSKDGSMEVVLPSEANARLVKVSTPSGEIELQKGQSGWSSSELKGASLESAPNGEVVLKLGSVPVGENVSLTGTKLASGWQYSSDKPEFSPSFDAQSGVLTLKATDTISGEKISVSYSLGSSAPDTKEHTPKDFISAKIELLATDGTKLFLQNSSTNDIAKDIVIADKDGRWSTELAKSDIANKFGQGSEQITARILGDNAISAAKEAHKDIVIDTEAPTLENFNMHIAPINLGNDGKSSVSLQGVFKLKNTSDSMSALKIVIGDKELYPSYDKNSGKFKIDVSKELFKGNSELYVKALAWDEAGNATSISAAKSYKTYIKTQDFKKELDIDDANIAHLDGSVYFLDNIDKTTLSNKLSEARQDTLTTVFGKPAGEFNATNISYSKDWAKMVRTDRLAKDGNVKDETISFLDNSAKKATRAADTNDDNVKWIDKNIKNDINGGDSNNAFVASINGYVYLSKGEYKFDSKANNRLYFRLEPINTINEKGETSTQNKPANLAKFKDFADGFKNDGASEYAIKFISAKYKFEPTSEEYDKNAHKLKVAYNADTISDENGIPYKNAEVKFTDGTSDTTDENGNIAKTDKEIQEIVPKESADSLDKDSLVVSLGKNVLDKSQYDVSFENNASFNININAQAFKDNALSDVSQRIVSVAINAKDSAANSSAIVLSQSYSTSAKGFSIEVSQQDILSKELAYKDTAANERLDSSEQINNYLNGKVYLIDSGTENSAYRWQGIKLQMSEANLAAKFKAKSLNYGADHNTTQKLNGLEFKDINNALHQVGTTKKTANELSDSIKSFLSNGAENVSGDASSVEMINGDRVMLNQDGSRFNNAFAVKLDGYVFLKAGTYLFLGSFGDGYEVNLSRHSVEQIACGEGENWLKISDRQDGKSTSISSAYDDVGDRKVLIQKDGVYKIDIKYAHFGYDNADKNANFDLNVRYSSKLFDGQKPPLR